MAQGIEAGVFGATTDFISQSTVGNHDIQRRPLGVGSSAINPTEADNVIFGFDFDQSRGVDRRDFVNAAGGGGELRIQGSIDHVEQKRVFVDPHAQYGPDQTGPVPRFVSNAADDTWSAGTGEVKYSHPVRSARGICPATPARPPARSRVRRRRDHPPARSLARRRPRAPRPRPPPSSNPNPHRRRALSGAARAAG